MTIVNTFCFVDGAKGISVRHAHSNSSSVTCASRATQMTRFDVHGHPQEEEIMIYIRITLFILRRVVFSELCPAVVRRLPKSDRRKFYINILMSKPCKNKM
jgi:hypothetical protein